MLTLIFLVSAAVRLLATGVVSVVASSLTFTSIWPVVTIALIIGGTALLAVLNPLASPRLDTM